MRKARGNLGKRSKDETASMYVVLMLGSLRITKHLHNHKIALGTKGFLNTRLTSDGYKMHNGQDRKTDEVQEQKKR